MATSINNNGLIVGVIFSIVLFLLTYTIIIPIVSILPGVAFESISEALVSNEPYSNVGKLTNIFLTALFLTTLVLGLLKIKRIAIRDGIVSKHVIAALMSILYFIVHPLGFYLYWGICLGYRSDGQLIFGVVDSFPISSFSFIFIGLLIDIVKNQAANTRLPKADSH